MQIFFGIGRFLIKTPDLTTFRRCFLTGGQFVRLKHANGFASGYFEYFRSVVNLLRR